MADSETSADPSLPTMDSMAERLATRVDALDTFDDSAKAESGGGAASDGSDPAARITVSVKDAAAEAGGTSANDALERALAENEQLRQQLVAGKPTSPAPPVIDKDPPAQVSGLRYAAMRELGDDAPSDLLDEFAAKLADEVYLEKALAHDGLSAEDKAKAGRQLATVRHHMRGIRTEAATKELQRSRDKAPADDAKAKDSEAAGPADLDSMRESLAASLGDEASLVEVEKVWPGFVGAVRAGVIRPDDDLVSMIGDVTNESEARESLARVCGLLDRVCARLNFASEAPAAGDAKAPPAGRAVADPSSLAFRRDEAREDEVKAFPTQESFAAELAARVTARGHAN